MPAAIRPIRRARHDAVSGGAAAAVAGVVLLGAVAASAAPPTPGAPRYVPSTPPATDAPAYVGSGVCVSCHPKAYDGWRGSNHARAMQIAVAHTVLGRFDNQPFTHFGVESRFFKRDGNFFVRTEGPTGAPADFEIVYTFGVEPLQQYLVELPNGRLQNLSIAWDSRSLAAGGQRWFSLYPNERIAPGDPLHWTGPDQTWNFMCASCHSTDVRKNYDAALDRYATTWSEIDVGCEACHGPADRHVDWARANAGLKRAPAPAEAALAVHLRPPGGVEWIIDPDTGNARPSAPPRMEAVLDVCAPCHARRSIIAEPAQPGQPLLDAYLPALLTPGLYYPDGQIEGEVYEYGSFVQSKMYQQGVTCTDCHAPHSLLLRAPGNGVCASCHLAAKYDSPKHHFHRAGSTGAQCVGCHMPVTTYMVIDPRHDHSLRVPRPDLSVELGTPNACTQCHRDRDAVWARDRVRAWYGRDPVGYQHYARALHAGRTNAAGAEALLARLAVDAAQPGIARATAFGLMSRPTVGLSSTALTAGLRDPDALVRRAALAALGTLPPDQRLPLAAPLLDDPLRAVRIEAARQLAAVPSRALTDAQRQRIERGMAEYVAAQRVDADRPESHLNVASLYADLGQMRDAEAELRIAVSRRPDFTPAYVNLADLYRVQQRDADGERLLREGLARSPNDAALQHALGLLLVRQRRLPEAVGPLRKAAELQPDEARYAYVLGVAEQASGRLDAALETLRAAHQRHPGDRDLLVALVTFNRDAGRRDAARDWARRLLALAPEDPSARQLAQQLGAAAPPPRP